MRLFQHLYKTIILPFFDFEYLKFHIILQIPLKFVFEENIKQFVYEYINNILEGYVEMHKFYGKSKSTFQQQRELHQQLVT